MTFHLQFVMPSFETRVEFIEVTLGLRDVAFETGQAFAGHPPVVSFSFTAARS